MKKGLMKPSGIAFLKKNAPVGCRDLYTKSLLEAHGIAAYFSGCMTLTLGKDYVVPDAGHKGVYVVDPYIAIPPIYDKPSSGARLGRFHIKNAIKEARIFPSIFILTKRHYF